MDWRGPAGAEWWVQIREGGGVGFHWDKDEDLLDSCGVTLCPQLSTVTYLTNAGPPTLVADCRPPVEAADTDALYDRRFDRAWLSYPECGPGAVKHLVFDGQLLHAVPEQIGHSPGRRVSFLVNIWLGHVPVGLSPVPLDQLALATDPVGLRVSGSCPQRTLGPQFGDRARFEAAFGPANEHRVSMQRLPVDKPGRCTVFAARGVKGEIRAGGGELEDVPCLQAEHASPDKLLDLYSKWQLVVVRGGCAPARFGLAELRKLWSEFPREVAKTWNPERGDVLDPGRLLGRKRAHGPAESWYNSFVLSSSAGFERALKLLPWAAPAGLDRAGVSHSPSVWFFVGRTAERIQGRAEHTDKVSHDGTWHAQQCGSKLWCVRPSAGRWPQGKPECGPLQVLVEEGDVILINTALWFHRTELPPTCSARERVSLSFARDFFLNREGEGSRQVEMDNLQDVWATADVPAGTLIASTEDGEELPELRGAGEPNCEVQVQAGGVRVVVAIRDICEGESLIL